jgi:hypothetical protein
MSWAVGALVNATGAVATNLGTVVMKCGAMKQLDSGGGRTKAHTLGFLLFVAGTLTTFASFAFAPQSLLAGVSAVQFVSNLVFGSTRSCAPINSHINPSGHFILGEPVTRQKILGTVILCSGIALLVLSSPKGDSDEDSLDSVFQYYYLSATHGQFLLGLAAAFCALDFAFWRATGAMVWRPRWRTAVVAAAVQRYAMEEGAGLPAHLAAVEFVLSSAMLGSQSVVSGKMMSLVGASALLHGRASELAQPRTYAVLAAWALLALFWVRQLARALAVFPGAWIIALLQVLIAGCASLFSCCRCAG